MTEKNCLFCGTESMYSPELDHENSRFKSPVFSCPNCGNYVVDRFLMRQEDLGDARFRLACLFQERRRKGEEGFLGIFSDECKPSPSSGIHKHLTHCWTTTELLSEFPTPVQIFDRALLNLSRQLNHPMDVLSPSKEDLPYLLFTKQKNVRHMWDYLGQMNLIQNATNEIGRRSVTITPDGWARIQELEETPVDSNQAFVAMWFNDEMEEYYGEGIKPAITDAGYDPRRIDNKEHNNKICDEIVAEIRKSRFVVADFTAGKCGKCETCENKEECKDQVKPRGGVYFEAGLAMGLGIPVIWTVRQDQIGDVHFDTRQYNHIVYESAEDLKTKLYNRIGATIQ